MFDNIIHGAALVCSVIAATLSFVTGEMVAGAWASTAGLWVINAWISAKALDRRPA